MVQKKKYAAAVAVAFLTITVLAGCGMTPRPQRMTIELSTPASRGTVTEAEVLVSGVVSEPGVDLTIGETTVEVSADGAFSHTVPLAYGSNRIPIRAEKEGFATATRSVNLTRSLTLTILSPEALSETVSDMISIAGTISDPTARVTVTGADVAVAEDGSFLADVPLYYIESLINVTAHVADTDPVTETITVLRPEV